MNTLLDLIPDYEHAYALLSEMIAHGNELLHQARQERDPTRVRALKARQKDLYNQRAHVQYIAACLRIYYDHSSFAGIE